MILIGDDDSVAGPQHLAERLRQHICVLRGRRAETDFVGADIHHLRQTRTRLVHLLAAQARGVVRPIGLNLALTIEPRQPADHLPARVGPAGVFKKRLARERRLGERWKLFSDKIDVEAHEARPIMREGRSASASMQRITA